MGILSKPSSGHSPFASRERRPSNGYQKRAQTQNLANQNKQQEARATRGESNEGGESSWANEVNYGRLLSWQNEGSFRDWVNYANVGAGENFLLGIVNAARVDSMLQEQGTAPEMQWYEEYGYASALAAEQDCYDFLSRWYSGAISCTSREAEQMYEVCSQVGVSQASLADVEAACADLWGWPR